MSGTSTDGFFSRQAAEARGPEPARLPRRKLKRSKLVKRIALASAAAVVVLAGVAAGGTYFAVNHLAGSVHRISGIAALDAANQPVMPVATRRSINVLLTGDSMLPASRGGPGVDHSSPYPEAMSGLISIIHLNASGRAGAVVNLPPNAIVSVPGHGRMQLWSTLPLGGPSLLIKTVEQLTNVRINHYSVVDFAGIRSVVGAMGGVDVNVPFTMTGGGVTFPRGINHLTAETVLAYVRQTDVSEIGREQLQSGLIRAIMDKIAQRKMLSRLSTDYRVLDALTRAFSVDSNLSNSQLESLAFRLGHLRGSGGTFVTAPTTGSPLRGGDSAVYLDTAICDQLWSAIRHDSVGVFGRRYPFTVTPGAPE